MRRRLRVVWAVVLASAACGRAEPEAEPGVAAHAASAAPTAHAPLPRGYATVDLGAGRAQRFGVRTEPAERRALVRKARTVGTVHTDETRESHVHVKWAGWVEEFFVSFVGQQVKRGDRLFSVYSPDLVTAQQELVIASRRLATAKTSERPGEVATAGALVEAARAKLLLWDVPEETVARIEKTRAVERAVTVRAPRSGTVIEKRVLPGMYVEPQMDLYVIADLSRVWVLVDLYEYEVPHVRVGQSASFSPVGIEAARPEIVARVVFVDPTVNAGTRTVKVRLEVANEDGALRPGAYGTVVLSLPLAEAVVIPADAILDTGERSLVFVRVGDGVFAPREVRTGARAEGRVQVLEGLDAGEEVVTRAQFILDSESRLRATAAARPEPPPHGAH